MEGLPNPFKLFIRFVAAEQNGKVSHGTILKAFSFGLNECRMMKLSMTSSNSTSRTHKDVVALSTKQRLGARKADEYVRIEVLFWHEDEVANTLFSADERRVLVDASDATNSREVWQHDWKF